MLTEKGTTLFVVSICGPSNAGKSQLAKATVQVLGATIASRIPVDYFLVPHSPESSPEAYFSAPMRWDWPLLLSRLALPAGTVTSTPDMDFNTFRRNGDFGGLPFTIRPVMICDAMAPYPESDLVVLLDVPADVRQRRIVERDQRWGTSVAGRWKHLEHAWWDTLQTLTPDLVLEGTRPLDVLAQRLGKVIGKRLSGNSATRERLLMTDEAMDIPVGTPVIALNGELLGKVREAHEHYVLIDQQGVHNDLDLPVDAVTGFQDGKLLVSVNRGALTEVDHEETLHRQDDGPGPYPD